MDERPVKRLEDSLNHARDELAAAEKSRDEAEPGSEDHSRHASEASRRWIRVQRLQRELEAVRLAGRRR